MKQELLEVILGVPVSLEGTGVNEASSAYQKGACSECKAIAIERPNPTSLGTVKP